MQVRLGWGYDQVSSHQRTTIQIVVAQAVLEKKVLVSPEEGCPPLLAAASVHLLQAADRAWKASTNEGV